MSEIGLMRAPASVVFGEGSLESAGSLAGRWGPRVTVCTDPPLAATTHMRRLLDVLRAAGLDVSVLDAAVAELPLSVIAAAIDTARSTSPDCLVGFGGGSSLDLTKLIALGLTFPDESLDAFYGEGNVPHEVLPVVAIPTTAGTGSEVSPVAVLSDPELTMKVGISSPHLIPRAAVCDPTVTHGAPTSVTAYAGVDALAHAIEAFTAITLSGWPEMANRGFIGKNQLSDRFALHAISCLAESLRGAVDDRPEDRARTLVGSLHAGLAFATAGTSLSHALQYPVGAATGIPHGLGIGLLLPHAMRFNATARPTELAQVASAMGLAADPDAAIAGVAQLTSSLGFPATLRDIGLEHDALPILARQAMSVERLLANNPRPVRERDALAVLEAAWSGDTADSLVNAGDVA